MSLENRRTKAIYAVINELVDEGASTFGPGAVTASMRDRGQPVGAWEVRGEFSILEADGLIELDAESGSWSLSASASKKATG